MPRSPTRRRIAGSLRSLVSLRDARRLMSFAAGFIFYQQAIFALGATASPMNIFYRKERARPYDRHCDHRIPVMAQDSSNVAGSARQNQVRSSALLVPGLGPESHTEMVVRRTKRTRSDPALYRCRRGRCAVRTPARHGRRRASCWTIANIHAL